MTRLLRRALEIGRAAFQMSAAAGLAPAPMRTLERHAAVQLRACAGQRLCCLAGSLWITQDGDPRDVVLVPGQVFQCDRSGGVVVSGLQRSRFEFDA